MSLFFDTVEDVDRGMDFIASRFPLSTHVVRRNATIQFRVSTYAPSVIFGHILANKLSLKINDFAVKHTTLDEVRQRVLHVFLALETLLRLKQVFVNFAGDNDLSKRPVLEESISTFYSEGFKSSPGFVKLYVSDLKAFFGLTIFRVFF